MIAPATQDLEQAQINFEQFFQDFLAKKKNDYEYGEFFESIYFHMCEYVGRKGKRVRPLLLLHTYRTLGGSRQLNDPSLTAVAISLELLHTFILIHDDVIDRSDRRRGLPTFHKLVEEKLNRIQDGPRVGENVAIVVGDIIFALAIETLNTTDFPPRLKTDLISLFLRYTTDTGAGEIYDILLATKDIQKVKREDIMLMYHLKTTRYTFEAPCMMGALLCEATQEQLQALNDFAKPTGLAFQILNDLQEFRHFDANDQLLSSDILEGKKTFLLCEAYERLNEIDRSFLQMCLAQPTRNDATIAKIKDLINRSEAVNYLKELCDELFLSAETKLNSSFSHEEIVSLTKITHRIKDQMSR
ncbi:MAG: polyprenyl synthetase family protein [Verrucomicrobiota bacterium]